jgi:hypothetical protein
MTTGKGVFDRLEDARLLDGVRATVARQLKDLGARHGIAVLVDNPET